MALGGEERDPHPQPEGQEICSIHLGLGERLAPSRDIINVEKE